MEGFGSRVVGEADSRGPAECGAGGRDALGFGVGGEGSGATRWVITAWRGRRDGVVTDEVADLRVGGLAC